MKQRTDSRHLRIILPSKDVPPTHPVLLPRPELQVSDLLIADPRVIIPQMNVLQLSDIHLAALMVTVLLTNVPLTAVINLRADTILCLHAQVILSKVKAQDRLRIPKT